MPAIQSIILGIIQGFTEFLPISSSAHLVLAPFFFNWTDPGLAYDVALHMGTLAAILLVYWKDWFSLLKNPFSKTGLNIFHLIIGTIPAVVIGLLFEKAAEENLRDPMLIASTLGIFGLLLWYADMKGLKTRLINSISFQNALLIGCAQAMAIVPGVSRSGITISAALILGFTRPEAARFSFLLSAPIIAGAGILKLKHILLALSQGGEMATAIQMGFVSSFASGIAAIGLLNYLVKTRNLNLFVAYRLLLSLIIIVIVVVR